MLQQHTQEPIRLTHAQRSARLQRIRDLNDNFRKNGMSVQPSQGKKVVTAGVQALGAANVVAIALKVMTFNHFTEDNDSHGEHDFGRFDHNGDSILWKIDYYAHDMVHGSPDPADPDVTCRVLTVMLASEW